jgi:hypothetical protein
MFAILRLCLPTGLIIYTVPVRALRWKDPTMMKRALLAAFAATMIATPLFAPALFAQEAKQDFRLVNRTGYELNAVFVSPSQSNAWGDDILGQATLDDAAGVNIKFHAAAKTCKWDLKVVYSVDSTSAVWQDIDLCSVEKITIKYNKKDDSTSASFD